MSELNDAAYVESIKNLKFTHDGETQSAYLYVAPVIEDGAVAHTYVCEGLPDGVKGQIHLDFDKDGRLLGIEVLDADQVLPGEFLG